MGNTSSAVTLWFLSFLRLVMHLVSLGRIAEREVDDLRWQQCLDTLRACLLVCQNFIELPRNCNRPGVQCWGIVRRPENTSSSQFKRTDTAGSNPHADSMDHETRFIFTNTIYALSIISRSSAQTCDCCNASRRKAPALTSSQ